MLGALGALSTGCAERASQAVNPESSTLKEIVESDLRNPEISRMLNARIDLLNADPPRLQQELRSSASEVEMKPGGCGTWLIVGQQRTDLLQRDDTVRARISLCHGNPARLRSTTVTFGRA